MNVDRFDFELPPERIAQQPAKPRDSARLLDLSGPLDAPPADRGVRDLPDLLQPGDLLVCNDTRVIPARIRGTKVPGPDANPNDGPGARIELTLHKQAGPSTWTAFAKPAKRLKAGTIVRFENGLEAETISRDGAEATLRFNCPDGELLTALHTQGEMPLPPYIKREPGGRPEDSERYQTVFAEHDGAVAAPTAGLHFTPELLARFDRVQLTLHVGAGTFLPVSVDNTDDHHMHSEWGCITATAAERINATRAAGGRIVAVGTTSLRLLESAADESGVVHPFEAETDIFITPGYQFRAVDMLLTNFHLPRSTLFMLICAFAGTERMHAAYQHAISNEYRFYSYGDACLLRRT